MTRSALLFMSLLVISAASACAASQTNAEADGAAGTTVPEAENLFEDSAVEDSIHDELINRARNGTPIPAGAIDDALFRLNGFDLLRPLQISLTVDHRLVIVDDTSVFAGPENFLEWQLSPEGADRVLEIVAELGDSPAAFDALADPSWLGTDIKSGPTPWRPSRLTIRWQDLGTTPPELEWPIDGGLLDRSAPFKSALGTGGVATCLFGDDANAIWDLTGGGQNSAHMYFVDAAGTTAQGSVMLNYPGYSLASDPCQLDFYGVVAPTRPPFDR